MDEQRSVIGASLVEVVVDHTVAIVRLSDEAGRNALSRQLTSQLEDALRRVAATGDVRVVILAGLPEYLCTGASQDVLKEASEGSVAPRDLLLPRVVLDVPVPVIAAMEGHAIGGGLALALCADLIIAARESWYSCNFMTYGFTPGMGTTGLLGHVLGPVLAAEMLYTGRRVKGTELERRSGLTDVLPRTQVMNKARELGERIAGKPVTALHALKSVLSSPKRQLFEAARSAEVVMHELTFRQPETARLIRDEYDL